MRRAYLGLSASTEAEASTGVPVLDGYVDRGPFLENLHIHLQEKISLAIADEPLREYAVVDVGTGVLAARVQLSQAGASSMYPRPMLPTQLSVLVDDVALSPLALEAVVEEAIMWYVLLLSPSR